MPTEIETLKPCPFCGGAAERYLNPSSGKMTMVQCVSCGASTFDAKWNRRTPSDELSRLSSAHSEAVEDARKHLAELAASRAEVVALREALAEAERRFEGLSHIHDGNPSDAMADMPPLDYARHMLWEARRECREGAREARAALAGEKPVGAGVETLATDYLRGKIGEIIALQLDIEGGRAVEQAVEQILAVAALSKSGEKP